MSAMSAFRLKTGLTAYALALLTRPMSNSPATGTRRPRPSMASYLRDSDEPILISTTFPKKARPTEPPTSLRTTSIPLRILQPTATTLYSSDSTPSSDRPLVGLLVKLNGEEIPFLIPRPSRPFRLPEAKPYNSLPREPRVLSIKPLACFSHEGLSFKPSYTPLKIAPLPDMVALLSTPKLEWPSLNHATIGTQRHVFNMQMFLQTLSILIVFGYHSMGLLSNIQLCSFDCQSWNLSHLAVYVCDYFRIVNC